MSIELKVYDNGDHTCLIWLPSDLAAIPDCRGFAIERTRNGEKPNYLHGFVGFSDKDKLDPNNPWKFPVQRYMWWDYDIKLGDSVQYRVVPVVGKDQDNLSLKDDLASALTPVMITLGNSLHTYQRTSIRELLPHNGFRAHWMQRQKDKALKT